MSLREFAPAKVNLFLHVGAAKPDGRHPISSLAVFADVGDEVEARPADRFSLIVEGPFAGDVGPEADNLVTRALAGVGAPGLAVRLTKRLPVAAGLGGGTSDAAAALRLAARIDPTLEPRLETTARRLGADGLLCLRATAALASGEGEVLAPAPRLPPLHAVLVNPRALSATGSVYRAYDEGPGAFNVAFPPMPREFQTVEQLAAYLGGCRNDLEAPAVGLRPIIGEALETMAGAREVLLTRMSGSGATVFGLFASEEAARAAASDLGRERPGWWIVACRLG